MEQFSLKLFGQRLLALRQEQHLTQKAMAEYLGCTASNYQKMEYGQVNVPPPRWRLCPLAFLSPHTTCWASRTSGDPLSQNLEKAPCPAAWKERKLPPMIIDLTHTITPEMPMYPGSAAPSIKPTGSLTRDGFRETQLTIASHTGTHMDAPSHMLPRGSTLEVLPASQFCGRAVVLDVSDLPPRSVITADYLREQNGTIRSADFVLFYTGWERKWGTGAYYDDDFPVPDQEAAKYLVSCGLKGVGTDALSVDTLRDQQFLAHKTLLDGGLVILESLCLKKVVGRTDLMLFALPLKFENADGAPVRAIAEFRDFPEEKEMEAL